jgi:bacterioferritin B
VSELEFANQWDVASTRRSRLVEGSINCRFIASTTTEKAAICANGECEAPAMISSVCICVIRGKLLVMLTSQKVIDAINEQIGYEFTAELQYYAIAAYFAAEALPQLSQHFFNQAEEEKGHALRFIKYVVDAGGRVQIPGIDAPKSKFKTPRDAIKLSLDQEVHVTKQINALVDLAKKKNDHITINFLQWFLTEQLEEVSSMDNLLKIIERAGTDLLQADEYLARVGLRTMPEPPKAT